MIPFELARLLACSFPITSKLIYKQDSDSKISLMMLKRLKDAKTTQKTQKSECVTDRPTDQPTDQPTDRPTDRRTDTVEYRVAFTRLKTEAEQTEVKKRRKFEFEEFDWKIAFDFRR